MQGKFLQFWLRKLHSLSGLLILGSFLLFHFLSPGTNIFKRSNFTQYFIFSIPLIFHSLYGFLIIYEAKPRGYNSAKNWQYIVQRATGVVIFLYLIFHLSTLGTLSETASNSIYRTFWILGIIAAVYHLSNGLFGFAIHFGIVVGPKSQRVLSVVSLIVFFLLAVLGLNAFSELTGQLNFLRPIYNFIFS